MSVTAPRRCVLALLLTGTVTLTASPAQATGPLPEWTATAFADNPELLTAHGRWQAAAARSPLAGALDDPMFDITYASPDASDDATGFMLSQRLPWFGRRAARRDAATLSAQAEGYRFLEVRRRIEAEVTIAAWNLWMAQQALAISQENQALLGQIAQAVQAAYEAGREMQANLLRAQVAHDRSQTDTTNRTQERDVAEARLNRLLAAPIDTPRRLHTPPTLPPPHASLEDLYRHGRQYCCTLVASILEIAAREATLRDVRRSNTPDFELRAGTMPESGSDRFQSYEAGVAISLPWLWPSKIHAERQAAQADLSQAEAELQNEIDMTLLLIKEGYTAADAGWRTMALYTNTVLPRTADMQTSAIAAYAAGNLPLTDVLMALSASQDAALAFEQVRTAYATDMARLDANVRPWTPSELETGALAPDMLHE